MSVLRLEDIGQRLVFAMGGQGQGNWIQIVPYAIVLAIMYFLILQPMRRQRKKVQEFQSSLKVGDKVVTTGGIYGLITRVNDNSVQLQVADKVRIEIARAAIGGYQGQEPVVQEPGSV
jgi:preprotein translocase subunit YajC